MFNLAQAIADWRKQMLAAGLEFPVPLEELEIHLREEIERQMKFGLNAQTAFAVAARKLGQAELLNKEFGKGAKKACSPKLFFIVMACVLGFVTCALTIALFHNSSFTPAQRLSGLIALALFNLLPLTGRLACRLFPVIPDARIRSLIHMLIGGLCALWLAFVFYIMRAHFDGELARLMTTALWALMVPIGIAYGLFAGIETAAWKKSQSVA